MSLAIVNTCTACRRLLLHARWRLGDWERHDRAVVARCHSCAPSRLHLSRAGPEASWEAHLAAFRRIRCGFRHSVCTARSYCRAWLRLGEAADPRGC